MGFELPLALLGLLAGAIPFVVHRMRKRELPRVVLPTFALLSRAAAQSQRRRTLQDLLLLALRVMIVVAAALALAVPYVTASVPFGDGRTAALAVVIDDSLSMSRRDGSTTLFARARDRAAMIAATLPPGSEVTFVLGGKPARVLSTLSRDLGAAMQRVSALPEIATRRDDLGAAVALASRELSRSQLSERRLLVLSDFARHVTLDPAALDLDGVTVAAERIGDGQQAGNVFVASAGAAPDPTQPGQTSVAVEARSVGKVPSRAKVEVIRSGTSVASAEIVLDHGGGRAVLHVPTPDDSDDPRTRVHLQVEDALPSDDDAGLVLTRADSVRVLLVNGDPRPTSDDDELHYVTHALALVPDTLLSISTRSIDPASLAHTRLASYDVVLLANVPAPDAKTVTSLLEFVKKGGGVIFAAGHRVDAASYNAALSELLPTHVTALSNVSELRFSDASTQLLPEGLAGLREVRTLRRLGLEPGGERLLAFEDGLPALVARDVGDGRSLVFASSLDADFTDLPLRPGFIPLLVAMIRDAAGAAGLARSHLAPGEPIDLPLAKRASGLEVGLPDGSTRKLVPDSATQRTLRFTDTAMIGAYRVQSISQDDDSHAPTHAAFVVRAPIEESDLTPGSVPAPARSRARADSSLVHKPLSNLVFLLAGLCVLVEGLARTRRRT